MKIIAIETSCDDTACSVVEDGVKVLSNVIYSQIAAHAKTGGVVPEVAAREHVLKMLPVMESALEQAKCTWKDLDAIAVTKGPGLISSLIIGTQTANVVSYLKKLPLIPVQHITGHIYSNWLDTEDKIQFPILILTVSGGHNELVLMRGHHQFEILGETRDDAAGEAFDKVARIMGLGYPGGPVISKIGANGDRGRFKLPRIMLDKGSFDFSFSGLKTAVLTEVKLYAEANGIEKAEDLDEKFKADLSACFEDAVVEVLRDKLFMAAEKFPEVKELHLAGGVSANTRLRELVEKRMPLNLKLRYPKSLSYCTDNAAMIGASAYFLYQLNPEGFTASTNITPESNLHLA